MVDHEVEIALTIARIDILKSMELLRQRAQRFGEEVEILNTYGDLSAPRLKYNTTNADDIADVKPLELFLVFLLA